MVKKVLVTGAGGFVGSNLVRRLIREGHDVTALVRNPSACGRLEDLEGRLDVRGIENGLWIREARFDWVFHLAAAGAYSWQMDSLAMVQANVGLTAQLLEWTEASESFVYAGSSSEYGYKDHAPTEDELPEPNGVYSATKLAGTALCQQAGRRLQRPTLTARLYSVFGPLEDPRRLIVSVIREGFAGKLPPFVDPAIARDFIHTEDVCDALILLANADADDPTGIYNLGSGVQTTIGDVARISREFFGIQAEPDWGSMPNRRWDTTCWVSDSSKIEREFGWKPKRNFEQGFRETAEWYQSRREWLRAAQFGQD